jgi:pyrroloquinoline quinone (PQQ) biosynthesis protein C
MKNYILNYINKNAQEGKRVTRELIEQNDNPNFIRLLLRMSEGYGVFLNKSKGGEISAIEKIATYLFVKINSNNSASHIASLLIESIKEEILELKKLLSESKPLQIGDDYLEFEEANINSLERYL